ncbi:MAG: adenosylcobinamide-GDP ribazoletransferase [Pseudomonadota bacterium]
MRLPLVNDVLIAFSLLTRLPVPQADWSDTARPLARAAWAYPLTGLVVSGIAVLAATCALWLGLPAIIAALIFLLCTVMATGAMHEDGLADCADGFWGGWEPARRLEIMKDSAIGTYGVLALLFSFGARWALYAELLGNITWTIGALLVPAVLSRTMMVCVMQTLPNARADGLSASTGKPGKVATLIALFISLISMVLLPLSAASLLICATVFAVALLILIARAKIGGQTGDVLGATQQVSEVVALMALVIVL